MESALTTSLTRFNRLRTGPLILELDLTEPVTEVRPADPVSAVLARRHAAVADIVGALKQARSDDRVRALVVKVGGRSIGLAMVQELRDALSRFRAAGKITIAWADSFGEFSAGNLQYYLASACETVYLQPSGDLGLTGLAVERVFVRGALDKLGVSMDVGTRHEYKSAAEQLTETGFSGPAREATERLTASVTDQLAAAIAERRSLSAEAATKLINSGPYLASQALDAGLVDALGYRDEVYAHARKLAGADAMLVYLGRYHRSRELADRAKRLANPMTPRPPRPRPTVALIHAIGPIRRGRSGRSPLTGAAMGSDTVAAALRAASADPRIRAIILRVNSPGGSYVASDSIWREVVRARAAGTPVIVSMSDVAASGGYFISMAADAIVAHPGTITGSIGVLTGKPVLGELLARAGVTTDSVVRGEHAAMFSAAHPFTEADWALVNNWLDHIYADFTAKVADGRRMTAGRVHELARGRVWTGADALENGLVDQLGGLEEAAETARRRAGLPDSAPVVGFPRLSPAERLIPATSSEDRRAAALADSWGPAWTLAARGLLPAQGPLLLPGSWNFN